MTQLPEEFHWDAVLIRLQCENKYLLDALMPLSLPEFAKTHENTSILPAIIKTNLTYKQRLDFEKKIEHLPIMVFWVPNSNTPYTHLKLWAKNHYKSEWLFPFPLESNFKQDAFINEMSKYKELYEIIQAEDKSQSDLIGLSQFSNGSCFTKDEAALLLEKTQLILSRLIDWAWLKDCSLSASMIEFVDQSKKIEIEDGFFTNLTQAGEFNQDFHFILPDALIRIIYSKSIGLNLIDAKARLNQEDFPQAIFKMHETLLNNWNQWASVKSIEPSMALLHDEQCNLKDQSISIINKASGSGVLITWKLEHSSLPLYRIKTFFSTEMSELLVKSTNSFT